MSNKTPLSIGALARATGVPVNTLRTWERRHGFPRSTRLPSGHRRYGHDQVQHVQWAHRAIQLGHKPSSLESLDISALQNLVQKEQREVVPTHSLTPAGRVTAWLQHVDRLDMRSLEKELLKGWSRHGAVGLCDHLLKPFLRELGQGWQSGRFTVAQEHAASECLSDFLSARWRRLASEANGPEVLLATLPEEQHVLGLHQVAVVLSMHGYRINFLGRGAPISALLSAVEQLRPTALMLGISLASSPGQTILQLLEVRANLPQDVQLVVGGGGAPQNLSDIATMKSMAEVNAWALESRIDQVA